MDHLIIIEQPERLTKSSAITHLMDRQTLNESATRRNKFQHLIIQNVKPEKHVEDCGAAP